MKPTLSRFASAALLAFSTVATAAARADETRIRAAFQGYFPAERIGAITRLPHGGLYEVIVNQRDVVYTDATGRLAIVGKVVDLESRVDLTAKRVEELRKVDFAALPLDKAIVKVKGNGKRRIAVFSDPDCPFCKRLEPELDRLDDVTIYTFLYPLAALHPDAMRKATMVWCAPDRSRAWDDLMLRGRLPEGGSLSCATPILEIIELARSLGISATPGIVLGNGKLIPGLVPLQELEAQLAAAGGSS
jgi:thiol:disulfide interchange protein DsbC